MNEQNKKFNKETKIIKKQKVKQKPETLELERAMTELNNSISSVQSLSRVRLFATPSISECQASLSVINSWG